jgi:hypothetical protein
MILMLLLVAAVPAAYAVLQQVGPVNNAPSVGGYPAWYQDTTGLALEYCDVRNQAEVDGGWCLLLPGDPPAVPEVFPGLFFDEHFWFAADATIVPLGNPTLRALLVLATEAAFGGGSPAPGDQIAFNRIRVRIDPVPATGTYRVIHPYGEESIEGTLGGRIFLSDDVGLVPGDFAALLTSRLGPFLLPSLTPGGAELAPVTGPVLGKLYIADPGRSGPVTGSPLPPFTPSSGPSPRNHNIFRIEGPAGSNLGGPGIDSIETTDFSLMGRIFQGAIAGRVTVGRASYARPVATPTGNKVDVFATALPSTQGRIPPNPTPAVITPQLLYVDGPCFDPVTGALAVAGLTSNQMSFAGSRYWGQSAPAVIPQNPAEVCVIQTNVLDAGGLVTSAFFPAPLGDQILITQALYDPTTQILSVQASSSDQVAAPTLPTLTVAGFGPITTGQFLSLPLAAPPAKVSVLSSKGGSNELQVSVGIAPTGPVAGEPVAVNDAVTVARNSLATAIPVLANDSVFPAAPPIVAGPTVALLVVTPPSLGTAVVNLAGTAIDYTPNLNASGLDSFTYTVTVAAVVSNVAIVTVTINDPPTAVNDSATATINVATQINVLANDTDPNGQADIVAIANLTQPTPAGASVAVNGNVVNFTGTAVGTYTFTYRAQDAQGALSNAATVTVTVGAGGTITVSRALLVSGTSLVVEGTVTPAGQTLTIQFATLNQAIAGSRVFTVTPRADGRWAISVRNITAPGSATQVKVTSSNGTVLFAPLVRQ